MSSPFVAALRVELRKVLSTPLWWILAGGAFLYLAFMGAVMAFGLTVPVEEGGLVTEGVSAEAMTMSVYGLPAAMGYVFPLVLGALSLTGEHRHRTLAQSLLVDPSRTRLLLSKVVVQGAFGLVLGLCAVLGVLAGALVVLVATGTPTFLGSAETWTTLGLTVIALALWGMVGVGFGAVVPNQVASIVVILAFTQLIEPLVRLGLAALGDAASAVSLYLPGAAAEALVGASIYTMIGAADLLPRWGGGAVLLAYALVFALVGRLTTLRRDVT